MAEEVSNFLNKVQEKAIHKGRIYAKNIDVNINEKETAKNAIGYCKHIKPTLKMVLIPIQSSLIVRIRKLPFL